MFKYISRASPVVKSYTAPTSRLSIRPTFLAKRTMFSSTNVDDFKCTNLFDVSHVTAVVTGGGSGIGLMITQGLVANGAKVYITGRREEVLEKVAEKYSTGPGKIIPISADITNKEHIQQLVKEISSKEPEGIQLLVNNAGIARDKDSTSFSNNGEPDMKDAKSISEHFMKSEFQDWEDTFRTNTTAGFFMSIAFLPLLAKGQEKHKSSGYTSSVVNVSSISGAMKGSSNGQFSYAASKAAFTHVTRMLATTFMETGVRVNCIAPGVFPSEMTADKSDENQKSQLDPESSNPAGRKGHDSDMAATILMLAGRGGTFYNHQIMYPDGGNTLSQPAAV